jgi:hypothetical protein
MPQKHSSVVQAYSVLGLEQVGFIFLRRLAEYVITTQGSALEDVKSTYKQVCTMGTKHM